MDMLSVMIATITIAITAIVRNTTVMRMMLTITEKLLVTILLI